MWHPVTNQGPLRFEGDIAPVMRAIVEEDPGLGVYHFGFGMGAVISTGYALALQSHRLRQQTTFVGSSFSSGVVNQILQAFGLAGSCSSDYYGVFCPQGERADRFIKPGIQPWFQGTKLSVDYYAAVLKMRLQGHRPVNPDSEIKIVATNYESHEPVVLTPELSDIKALVQAARASAYLPCLGKGYVMVDGEPLTDGGLHPMAPLDALLECKPKYLLIHMASDKSSSLLYRTAEWLIVQRSMRHASQRNMRRLAHARYRKYEAFSAFLDSQLALPIGDGNRRLPPTLLVSTKQEISLVEQRPDVIAAGQRASYHDWMRAIAWAQSTCNGGA